MKWHSTTSGDTRSLQGKGSGFRFGGMIERVTTTAHSGSVRTPFKMHFRNLDQYYRSNWQIACQQFLRICRSMAASLIWIRQVCAVNELG